MLELALLELELTPAMPPMSAKPVMMPVLCLVLPENLDSVPAMPVLYPILLEPMVEVSMLARDPIYWDVALAELKVILAAIALWAVLPICRIVSLCVKWPAEL